ncbi:MAG: hypothetical protein M1816_001198 [Peltula sp. TS41687]|nr:MAG: hypothetical protein M1816_001198 [Peltula sp. TS41687]
MEADSQRIIAMFSPLGSPTGLVLYDISTAIPPDSYLSLAPFELFRVPLIVIGLADGLEQTRRMSAWESNGEIMNDVQAQVHDVESSGFEHLLHILDDVQEQYPKALVHRVILFDTTMQESNLPEGIMPVPPPRLCKTTTMKTVMCDITSLFLAEMTTFAKSLQGLPSIDSPGFYQANHGVNGHMSWSGTQSGTTLLDGRRSSRQSASRSESPGLSETSKYRMSMPAQVSSFPSTSSNPETGSRRSSPPRKTRTPPPSSSDDVSGFHRSPADSPAGKNMTKSSLDGTRRELSRDRVEVHGFGSGSLSERARNKGRGRVGVVIGALYLLAGRWEDAVRESVENANVAKANSDHLWHAKALENILVGLIMLAWAGLDFQIPSVCYPIAEKSTSLTTRPGQHAGPNGTEETDSTPSSNVPHRLVSLQNLVTLLPDLLNLILSLLNRASALSAETLPQLAYSEFIIRYAKILAAAHVCAGRLDDDALQHLVLNVPLSTKPSPRIPRIGILPSRTWISSILFRAMPSSVLDGGLSTIDRTIILAGIASVLSSLGFQRKKAFVMRELVATLIPGLIQARKFGAAEMGVHPAAGLALTNATDGDSIGRAAQDMGMREDDTGLQALLLQFTQAYGATWPDLEVPQTKAGLPQIDEQNSNEKDLPQVHPDNSNEATIIRIIRHASLRPFGNRSLKLLALRYCINLCEALPDFAGVLRFTSGLLRNAGSGIAPGAGSREGSVTLSREEQVRLATTISRTISAARNFGLTGLAADYWDEFLIRGVELLTPPWWKLAVPRRKEDIVPSEVAEEKTEKTPFIYNPYLKKTNAVKDDKLLVAGEHAEFKITLQNLYDFEVEIERLLLDTKGVEFVSMEHGTIIGPYRKQTMVIAGIPKMAGSLEITGCIVKVSGCWERRFPIFSNAWSGPREFKIGTHALGAPQLHRPATGSEVSSMPQPTDLRDGPKASVVSLNVIEELPLVVLNRMSLSYGAMMLLEGETLSVTMTLQNLSTTTPVDMVLFSSEDSTSTPIQAAMRNKDTPPVEMYELELFLQKHAFRWKRKTEANFHIDPGGISELEVEVLGKPGLTSGVVQLDCTHLGAGGEAAAKGRFYTRQVRIPLTITVNASVELVHADILPFSSDLYRLETQSEFISEPTGQDSIERGVSASPQPPASEFEALFERLKVSKGTRHYCLLLLDLRNAWPNPLTVTLHVDDPSKASNLPAHTSHTEDGGRVDRSSPKSYTISKVVQPGHVTRFMLPLPRIYLTHPNAPIPILDAANRRQFIVRSEKSSPEAERVSREAFWYREAILGLVRGTWSELGTARHGTIGLRGMRLSPRTVHTVKLKELGIDMHVSTSLNGSETAVPVAVTPLAQSRGYQVPTDEFVLLKVRLTNRTTRPIQPLLRLQPSLRHQAHPYALDISKRLLWNGLLQQPLPVLGPGESREVAELGLCLLARGEYEINATVEEVRTCAVDGGLGDRQRDNGANADGEVGRLGSERQTWHAEEACVIVAL